MSDESDAAAATPRGDRWVVLALTVSAFLLAWLLKGKLDALSDANERINRIDREIDRNLPRDAGRAAVPTNARPPGLDIDVEHVADGRARISLREHQARWWVPPPQDHENRAARDAMIEQITSRVAEVVPTLEVRRARIHLTGAWAGDPPVWGTMIVVNALTAAELRDIVLEDLVPAAEAPR